MIDYLKPAKMQILETTKKEIEAKAQKMSDFLRMEYLESCSSKLSDIEILRYCYPELARLYESRSMYPEAIKYISKFKEITILRKEKNTALAKEMELNIKGGFYDKAEHVLREILKNVNASEGLETRRKIVELYKKEAEKMEKLSKYSGALKIYEKLIHHVTDTERLETKKKMLIAYKKLGRIKESLEIEKEIERDSRGIEFR